MNTRYAIVFSIILSTLLAGCNTIQVPHPQSNYERTALEDCTFLVGRKFIGQNGPEVCVTTPLSKNSTSLSGVVVGAQTSGPFFVTAINSDGGIVKQTTTQSNGEFTMNSMNLQNMAGKGIAFSAFVNDVSSLPTNLVVGQEPASICSDKNPDYPRCGTYPGAIFYNLFKNVFVIFSVPQGEQFGLATLDPDINALVTVPWTNNRVYGYLTELPAPAPPGSQKTIFGFTANNDSFAYGTKQKVVAGNK